MMEAESTHWPYGGRNYYVKEIFQWRNRESNPRPCVLPQTTTLAREAILTYLLLIMEIIHNFTQVHLSLQLYTRLYSAAHIWAIEIRLLVKPQFTIPAA
jgi:hypothetical protein